MSAFLPRLLAYAAERHPDKAAFACGAEELSYQTLVARSNQLANALAADGVRPGDRVGILMGKAIENAIAVYGIMAAGAAYVPLDPAAPVSRLEQIARSCGLRHFVIDGPRAGRMTKLSRALDGPSFIYGTGETANGRTMGWDEIATLSPTAPVSELGADATAYLIFTSGSTGPPKGIIHTHGSGSAYASMAAGLYGLSDADRLSNFPPLHFDQSTFDFFSGPLVGATTVIIDKEHQLVPASLSQLIERERLTVWYSVPLALVQLLLYGALDERDCSTLRWVIYGGEPFPLKHLKALMEHWPTARFSNCYGPAEVNQCTYHHLEPLTDEAVAADAGVPIGVACPGMATMVVDADDNPVPRGDSGELLVHSPTMMTGYWGRDDLDDRVFLDCAVTGNGTPETDAHRTDADQNRTGENRRFYRTGDIVRVDDDGLLQFLGRRDRQIKTRGVRVELDEVEAALSTHEAVQEVAVTTVPDAEDGRAVVAYVTVRSDNGHGKAGPIDEGGLKRHAATRLSRAAVPSSIVFLNRFPRTTSGKVDYLALTAEGDRS